MSKLGSAAGVLLLAAATQWSVGLISISDRFTERMHGSLQLVQHEIGPRWHLSARRYGRLASGAVGNHPFALSAGIQYQLVAVCDVHCSELTLALFDENGREVDRDVRRHTWLSLQVIPVRSATFQLKVSMAGCRQVPCAYGVGLFSGGR
jgi:hypothetical protein